MGETARRESARMVADFVRERIPDGATVIVGGDSWMPMTEGL